MTKKRESVFIRSLLVLYSLWTAFWFISSFLLLYPLMLIFLQKIAWRRYAHRLVRLWGQIFFICAGMRIQVKYHYKPDRKRSMYFVPTIFPTLTFP